MIKTFLFFSLKAPEWSNLLKANRSFQFLTGTSLRKFCLVNFIWKSDDPKSLVVLLLCLLIGEGKKGGQNFLNMDINDSFRMLNLNIIFGIQHCFSCWLLNSNLIWTCTSGQLQYHQDAHYLPQTTRGHLRMLRYKAK